MKGVAKLSMALLALLLAQESIHAQGWRPGQPPPRLHLEELRGVVDYWRPGTAEVVALAAETSLAAGDEIRTGADGFARIGLEDGSKLEILPDSWVRLGVASASWMRTLELFLGQVRILIERLGGKPNPYTFATPTAVLGVRGTIFDVAVDDTNATMVAVQEGIVHVENARFPGRGVLVRQGYRTIVRPDELPMRPERTPSRGGMFGGMEAKHGRPAEQEMGTQRGGMAGGTGPMGLPGTMGGPGMTGSSSGTGMPGGSMPGMGGMRKKR